MTPLKLAIIGGGPSAFYVASRIFKLAPQPNVRIHIYDRLWAPHGLVRYGVAPDHPEVKNCTHKFDQTGLDPRFRFFGNVNITDNNTLQNTVSLSLTSLASSYTHILFATGCTRPTLHPSLPPHPSVCVPALSIVHWYTSHPNSFHLPPPLENTSHISIIGNGNVSLDVARILLTNVDVLAKYDVPDHVLDVLSKSKVKHISIIGRRGPLEAAFTMKELREMMNLPEASMVPLDSSLLTPPPRALTRQQSRILQLLNQGSKNRYLTTPKSWSLEFYRSPLALSPASSSKQHALELALSHTTVSPTSHLSTPTGTTSTLPTDLVVTSLGFHSEPSPFTFYDPASRHLRNLNGRIVTPNGEVVTNMYASGWAATGAKGVLASTMMNAYDVADVIISDFQASVSSSSNQPINHISSQVLPLPGLNFASRIDDLPEEVESGIREGKVIQYGDWKKVDEEEIRKGREVGKERERIAELQEVRKILRK